MCCTYTRTVLAGGCACADKHHPFLPSCGRWAHLGLIVDQLVSDS